MAAPRKPPGDQFAGKGRFKPGKGPGGVDAKAKVTQVQPQQLWMKPKLWKCLLEIQTSEKQVADKEKQLQDKALGQVLTTAGNCYRGKSSPEVLQNLKKVIKNPLSRWGRRWQ